jgi:Zn-dependent protease/predicted transcriptional regulator
MRWSIHIGTLFGIRLELHITFLLFLGWVAVQNGLLTGNPTGALLAVAIMLMIFLCVILHELGHALTARRYGIRTRDIILLPIGGVARLQRMPDRPSQELVVALAGPAVNVVIAGVLWLSGIRLPSADAIGDDIPGTLLWINVLMVLFNLIPAFPMDGGRVLRALLAMILPFPRATRIASTIGQLIAVGLGILGLAMNMIMLVFVALFVFLSAGEERAMVETRSVIGGLPVRDAMVTDYRFLDPRDPLQRAVDFLMSGNQQDFPVLDDGRLLGTLTRSQLVGGLQRHGAGASVGDVLEPDREFADAGESLDSVLQRMRERGRMALPVFQNGQLVGLITLENVGDLLVVRDALRRFSQRA